MQKKIAITFVWLLVVGLLIAACVPPQGAGNAPAASTTGKQKLLWSIEGVNELPGLDPANPQNAQSVLAINLIFGGLVKLDAQLNVVGDGAESWTLSEDGKTYTFKIR
ncbi:MAG: peptide ABC transporter substrate-binding protein, partial [Chloroflexi bacterium]|nr:peptide ABC transporter substrate-binding protein [Chloroflexota bacterium]